MTAKCGVGRGVERQSKKEKGHMGMDSVVLRERGDIRG